MKRSHLIIIAIFIVSSCNNPKPAETKTTSTASTKASIKIKYTKDMVHNKKDFVCGMPVTGGIEDTCHYKGKVYGFCSKECKEAFLKNPGTYLTAK